MEFDLPFIWAGLIATAIYIYVVLDGFDLGRACRHRVEYLLTRHASGVFVQDDRDATRMKVLRKKLRCRTPDTLFDADDRGACRVLSAPRIDAMKGCVFVEKVLKC